MAEWTGVGGGAIEQGLRGIEPHLEIGELPLQTLKFAQQATELFSRQRMFLRRVKRVAAKRQRARRVTDALDVEATDLLLESPGAQEDVLGWNPAVLKDQLTPLLPTHVGVRRTDSETWSVTLDEHRADAVYSRPKPDVDQIQGGVVAVRRPQLCAVEEEALPIRTCRPREVGDRRSALRLAHAKSDERLASKQS